MTAVAQEVVRAVGDYDLRGPDFETLLVGPVTPTIIDADRIVREEWHNGFPNWDIYRVVFAGDSHLRGRVRHWCIAFALALADGGLIRKDKPTEEMAAFAGWDTYSALLTGKWAGSSREFADALGIDHKTYTKLRNAVYRRIRASLDEYWIRLQIAMRQVALMERRQESPAPAYSTYSLGRGFSSDGLDVSGTGNWIAPARGSGC